ncbi:MAG: hypothetical protein JWN11_1784 [Hyphomicrobiales bacterium]|nr:hypothetical protein [Hyphomicrobiales bacterium]
MLLTIGLGLAPSVTAEPTQAAPDWPVRGLVATRISGAFSSANKFPNAGGKKEVYEQSRLFLAEDCTDLSLLYHHVGNQQASGLGIGSFTVKASLFRCPVWGDFDAYAVATWEGGSDGLSRSPTIGPGEMLQSNATGFGGNGGDLFFVRRHLIFSSAPAYWPGSQINLYEGDEVLSIGDGLTERISGGWPATDWAGGYYSRDDGVAYAHSAPALVIGQGATRKARLCIVNDSIGMGSGDNGAVAFGGWPARLLGTNYPWYLVGNEGYALTTLMSDETIRAQRLGALEAAGITHLLVQAITNDLGQNRTSAQFLSDCAALQAELSPLAIRLILCTSTPRTNAANNAKPADDADAVWAERLTLNQAIRDHNGVGHGYLDAAAFSQAAGNANLWDDTSGRGSTDGLHPNEATHINIATMLADSIDALLSVSHFA